MFGVEGQLSAVRWSLIWAPLKLGDKKDFDLLGPALAVIRGAPKQLSALVHPQGPAPLGT